MQGLSMVRQLDALGADGPQFAHDACVRGFTAIEELLMTASDDGKHTKFCVGDDVTIADLFVGPQVENAQQRWRVSMTPFPNIRRLVDELDKLPEVAAAKPRAQPDTARVSRML